MKKHPTPPWLVKPLELLAAGRMTLGQFKRLRRMLKIRQAKRAKLDKAIAKQMHKIRRANRNLYRWEQKHGYPGTTCCIDRNGKFHYWNFERNEVVFWGFTPRKKRK